MLNPCSPTLKHKGCRQEVIEKKEAAPPRRAIFRSLHGRDGEGFDSHPRGSR